MFMEQSQSAKTTFAKGTDDDIHVVMQYFVHPNPGRDAELKTALKRVCENPHVTKVHLLNECIYDHIPVGKIVQHNIGRRLQFNDVFQYLRKNKITGYHVIINSDICFDDTLANLRHSELHLPPRKMMALLRYEDDTGEIFGPRVDSQDTWIFHSRFAVPEMFDKLFSFAFGKPGCDNKLAYLMRVLGYEVINDPAFVKTWHIHASQERNYTIKDRVPPPYFMVGPSGHDMTSMAKPYAQHPCANFDDNDWLHDFILAQKKCFSVIDRRVEIYHHVYHQTPWTWALRGKRLYIPEYSPERAAQTATFYNGIDLFPDCTFTQSQDETCDVAIVSDIRHLRREVRDEFSVICVGNVLPLYFGIMPKTWLFARPDMARLFLNASWKAT